MTETMRDVELRPIVYIVDDDEAVRGSIELLMQVEAIPAKAYASAESFLENFDESAPGCLLVDVRMPGMSGLELIEVLASREARLPVIVMTGHGDVSMAVRAMKMGALDFIEKPLDNGVLLDRIQAGFDAIDQQQKKWKQLQDASAKIKRLTAREHQVMELLVKGKQNKVIAAELGISPRTVELHRAKVMEKFRARSLSEVVRTAFIAGGGTSTSG